MPESINNNPVDGNESLAYWTRCPKCKQQTAATSFFCINERLTLVAFSPRLWATATLVLAPTLVVLLLSIWNVYLLLYVILTVGILLYLRISFRHVRTVRRIVMCWTVSAFGLVGVDELLPADNFMARAAACAYFLLFGVLIIRRALTYVQEGDAGLSVAISMSSPVIALYSGLLEISWLLGRWGMHSVLWLQHLYVRWFFWVWSVRCVLIGSAVVILAVKASNDIVRAGGTSEPLSRSYADYLYAQFRQWADSTYAWAIAFKKLLVQSMTTIAKLALHFLVDDVIPALIILLAAYLTLRLSIALTIYMAGGEFPAPYLGILGIVIVVLISVFGYLELIASADTPTLKWPPLLVAVRPFWRGATTDIRVLAFNLSYIIPLTTLLLGFVHLIAKHFKLITIFPGFGFYSLACLLILGIMLFWGYRRRRREKM